jgi:hypothetical protein
MESSGMTGAYIWMGIFLVASALFWGTAFWAIVRGGKDAFDIIITEKKSKIPARRVS